MERHRGLLSALPSFRQNGPHMSDAGPLWCIVPQPRREEGAGNVSAGGIHRNPLAVVSTQWSQQDGLNAVAKAGLWVIPQTRKEDEMMRFVCLLYRSISTFSSGIIALVLMTLLWSGVSALGLAASGSSSAKKVIKIWDWSVHDKKYKQKMVATFNKEHPDIQIQYVSQVGAAYNQMISLAYKVGEMPDMFWAGGDLPSLWDMVEDGKLLALEDIAPKPELIAWKATFPKRPPAFIPGEHIFYGKTYTWPQWGAGVEAGQFLFYNKRLFKLSGLSDPPKSWDDFRDYAKKITAKGKGSYYGVVFGAIQPWVFRNATHQFAVAAGSLWNLWDWRTARITSNDPTEKDAIRLFNQLKADGVIFPGEMTFDDEGAKRNFALDRAAMIVGGPWNAGGTIAYTPNADFDVALMPSPDGGPMKGYQASSGGAGGGGYFISASTKHPEAIWPIIKFLTSREYQEGYVKSGGGFAIFPEYNKPEFFPHIAMSRFAQWSGERLRLTPNYTGDLSRIGSFVNPLHPDDIEIAAGIYLGREKFEALDDYVTKYNAEFRKAVGRMQQAGYRVKLEDFMFPDWDPAEDYIPKTR